MKSWSPGRSSGSRTPDVPLSYRVDKMRLTKDKTALEVNDSLTLAGIPPESSTTAWATAAPWSGSSTSTRSSEITGRSGDRVPTPTAPDDPEYIVRLVGQVVRVSVETVKIVETLPAGVWLAGRVR